MNATKLCVASAYLLLFIIWAWSQGKTNTSTIVEQGGLPFPEVNILVESTTNSVQSNFEGNFTIGSGIGQALHEIVINGVSYFFIHSGTVPCHYSTASHNKVLKG